ncbi:conserved exported hypothetical protein [Desulfamplus magnetovallimortis]|uniref:RND efflux pump membrane fusion protein barrel-sandwich domain-containing protein n=1 Tax=Desulfamplus magnetovallimortis TaxID=1246637 RepID=A0A1W1HIR7_9BACT|nr:HlyD family efflux transporter periplasmic adaptor subunit [Desulfamplus magnetovallimortis]SLM32340.1 conserved exported hypothetical protein [Desulfamplus magnetovallimortis]
MSNIKQLTFIMIFLFPLLFFSTLSFTELAHGDWQVEKSTKKVKLKGYTRSFRSVTLSAEAGGRIIEVNYETGDEIGDKPLAEIDTTFISFEIENTKFSISRLNARLKQINSRVAYLEKEFRRKDNLYKKGHTTEVIRDSASQELDQAQLEREALLLEQKSLDVTLKQLLEKKRRYTIKGFKGWTVTERKAEPGEIIQTGMSVAVIQDFRKLLVPLSVSGEELESMMKRVENQSEQDTNSNGQKMNFPVMVEGLPARASIYSINPAFDEQSRKINIELLIEDYPSEVAINNNPLQHRGGLACTVALDVYSRGLKIPAESVLNRYENPKVFIKGKDAPVMITILDTLDNHLIIADHPELSEGTLLTNFK